MFAYTWLLRHLELGQIKNVMTIHLSAYPDVESTQIGTLQMADRNNSRIQVFCIFFALYCT